MLIERFIAAVVGPPFGLTGRVKIESASGEESHLLGLTKVTLRKGAAEQEFQIEEVFSSPLSIKFAGFDSPEAAKTLKGREILLPREAAAPLNAGEFYIEDLKGLKVYITTGGTDTVVGEFCDILEGGGGFLAEILLTESAQKRLVPFRDEFFGIVDPAAGTVELLKPWILD